MLVAVLLSAVPLAFAAAAAESRISLNKDVYEAKEPIIVEYEAAPGKPNDFITIVKQSARAGSFAQYHYLRLQPRGRFEFRGLPPGTYEARLQRHGVAIPEAIAPLIVQGGPAEIVEQAAPTRKTVPKASLEIAHAPVQTGEEIKVTFKAPGTANDWITIVRQRAPGNESGRFEMLEGRTEGEVSFEGLPPGRYEVRLFGGDRNRLLARTPLSIEGEWREPDKLPSVKTEKPFYRNNESIVAYYEGAWIKDETDHLLIAEVTRHDSNWTRWVKALHAPEGWVRFEGQFSGAYELRLYRGRSKDVVARYRFDIGEVLAEKYPELAGGALAEAVGWAARCDVLVDWIIAWRHDYPMLDPTPRRPSEEFWRWLTKPFLDPAFIPVFGSPIEKLEPETREFIYPELLRQCRSLDQSYRVFFEGVNDAFGGGFQSRPEARANVSTRTLTFERAAYAAERQRVSAKRLAEAEATLDALVMDETAYPEVLAIEALYASDLGWVTAGEGSRYRDRLETRRTSAASIALKFRADELVASAEGLAGAHALAAFESKQAQVFSHADERAAAAVRAGIEEAIATQLRPVVDDYASRLSEAGSGAAGVRALRAWYQDINRELGGLVEHRPARQLMSTYIAREREIVPADVPELLADVAALPTLEASYAFRKNGLGRPEAWELVLDTPLPAALRDRQVELWAGLEASDQPFWPLPETSPATEKLLAERGIEAPTRMRAPMGHEIMLAMIDEIEAANGERVGSNAVVYRLLPLNAAVGAVLSPSLAFRLPSIQIPVEGLITLRRVSGVGCSRTASQSGAFQYACSYRVSADVEGLPSGLFANTMSDTFELTGSGWRSPTMSRRLEEASVLAWGAISEGVVSGLGAAGCIAGAFGGVVDLDCY